MLLLEIEVLLVQFLGLLLGDVLEPELEDLPGPVVLSLADLKFAELDEVVLVHGLGA